MSCRGNNGGTKKKKKIQNKEKGPSIFQSDTVRVFTQIICYNVVHHDNCRSFEAFRQALISHEHEQVFMCTWTSPASADHRTECSHDSRTLAHTGAPLTLQELLKTEHTHRKVLVISGCGKYGRLCQSRVASLTFPAPGCQASRHRDFALLTSLVFCSRGQLIT